jgi:hypothetical protein
VSMFSTKITYSSGRHLFLMLWRSLFVTEGALYIQEQYRHHQLLASGSLDCVHQ